MSDIFDFSSVDPSTFDPATLDQAGASLINLSPDFSTLTAPLVAPVLNLPLPTSTGISGLLGDVTKLVTGAYASQAQITAAQSAAALAKAKAANQLQTVKTTPNVWLVLGLGAAAVFTLELMSAKK